MPVIYSLDHHVVGTKQVDIGDSPTLDKPSFFEFQKHVPSKFGGHRNKNVTFHESSHKIEDEIRADRKRSFEKKKKTPSAPHCKAREATDHQP